MPKPVCVPCQRFFRPAENGFAFIEGMPIHNEARAGVAEPESWRPYKVWMADKWACPDCGATILMGFGAGPVAEHYQPDFPMTVERLGADQLQVNDC